jgi:SAM-dependent methyltransferase
MTSHHSASSSPARVRQSSPTRWSTIDWYDTPRYYDIVFDTDTKREADFLEEMLRRHGRPNGARVLEPACGSGRLVSEMARRGFDVLGFDRNAAMLEYAARRLRSRGLSARLEIGELATFQTNARFDLAVCLVSTFKYLLDERSARSHLQSVARGLVPGGIYVLGFHLTDYGSDALSRERWVATRGRTRVVCNTQVWPADRRKRLEDVRTRLLVTNGARKLRNETRWQFRTYDARQVRALLASVPELEHVATYDFTYRPDRPRTLSDDQLDIVLVLQRRRG